MENLKKKEKNLPWEDYCPILRQAKNIYIIIHSLYYKPQNLHGLLSNGKISGLCIKASWHTEFENFFIHNLDLTSSSNEDSGFSPVMLHCITITFARSSL